MGMSVTNGPMQWPMAMAIAIPWLRYVYIYTHLQASDQHASPFDTMILPPS